MSLADLLIKHEGFRLTVYDDATGKPILPGSVVIGYPTVGIGRNLVTRGLTKQEALDLLQNDIDDVERDLLHAFPWYAMLTEVRQDVLASLCFNVGIGRLQRFKKMIEAVEREDWEVAAREMLDSQWALQVGRRARELAEMMRTGSVEGK